MKTTIRFTLNGKKRNAEITSNQTLFQLLRQLGMVSVKCGCETSSCGLCTVLMEDEPVLSCSVPAFRIEGKSIMTLEGLQEEAEPLTRFIAAQGAEQCGFCNSGYVMNIIAMLREIPDPTDDEIRTYLAGNLCRCSGYEGQLRGIRAYLTARNEGILSREPEEQ